MSKYDNVIGELNMNKPGIEARYCKNCYAPLLPHNKMMDSGYCTDCAEGLELGYKKENEEGLSWEGEPTVLEDVPFEENDPVNPNHYKQASIELIDFMQETCSKDEFNGYCKNNVLKYVVRYKQKNGVEDLKKAMWYLDRLIQSEEIND